MDVQAYLKRISVEKEEQLTLEYLAKLQKNHMEKIPFENLDVTRKVKINLIIDRFHEKVMKNGRGGFCYELNGLFQQLLTNLGYRSHLIACTVKRPKGWAKADTHAAIIVHLDRPYLVDVGFGDSVRKPIPLTGEEQTDVSGTYRVIEAGQSSFDLQRLDEDQWKILYRFSTAVKNIEDFEEGSLYNQTSPDSTFTHGDIVTLGTSDGRITLSGLTVTITKNGQKEKWELSSEEEKIKFLKEHFHINI
ncbi:arylamine N-acetyltransferase family protein [Cytobacillus praedii]|uniref:Arylamine N-acetyltransferase n=1 Tax=Cytobacillus praedii TaxID=1742358 RepID=A0A4R1B0N9_9BACI|nr:arylamine N-acetyltransferase [Cytobacillus praedii]TCJ03557.1 arylamine N-acetyltransferase [Cytobacillus praedii]